MTEVLSVADIDLETLARVGPGRGVCVGLPLAGVGLRIEPLPGGDGACGEIVVSAPWLSLGYDGLWATNDRARTVDEHGVEWHRTGDVGHLDDAGRLWVEGRLAHVVATADGPVTPVPLEIAVTEATGLRCAVTGVGPDGSRAGRRGRRGRGQGRPRRARYRSGSSRGGSAQPLAAVLSVPHLPVDVRHNSKVDRTRLGRWAGKVLEGGSAPRRV